MAWITPQRLANAFDYDGQHSEMRLEVDDLFEMFERKHETFFQHLLNSDFDFIIDAYNDFISFAGDLEDIIM